MKPITFEQQNFVFNPAKGQEDKAQPLPCYIDDLQTVSLWELTDEEVDWIVANRKIWLSQWNGRQPLQPQRPFAEPFSFPAQFAFCIVRYTSATSLRSVRIWNGGNFQLPDVIEYEGETMYFDPKSKPQFIKNNPLNIDDLYFRQGTHEEVAARSQRGVDAYYASQIIKDHNEEERATMEGLICQNSANYPVLVRKLQAGKEDILF